MVNLTRQVKLDAIYLRNQPSVEMELCEFMRMSSRQLLLKAKHQKKIKHNLVVLALAIFIAELGLIIFGITIPYESLLLGAPLVAGTLIAGELFGVTKNQLISELEKARHTNFEASQSTEPVER
ncbi:hypothetical protein OAC77_00230 [Reinekea forsetii]|nr:hypothetical protein [Reinekea forsetii]